MSAPAPQEQQVLAEQDRAVAPRRSRVPLAFAGLVAAVLLLALADRAADGREPGGLVLTGGAAWSATAVAALVGLALLAVGFLGPARWRYRLPGQRDLRLDWIRGLAITFVVLDQVSIPSLFQLLSQEAIGPVSAAELFVALSGVVLGVVYRDRVDRLDLVSVTGALWSRAFLLYRTALAVVLGVFLLTLVPGVDGRSVTTYTDPGTDQVFDLYPNMGRLLDYPVPGFLLRDIVLLRVGPYQFNIIGLYVVLFALAPALVAALRARLVLPVLAISWLLYLASSTSAAGLVGARFEDPFPLLAWQLLFVHGAALGWYRSALVNHLRRGWGRIVLSVIVLTGLGLALFSANNHSLANGYDARLAVISGARFVEVYQRWFSRTDLGLGRVLATFVVLVTLYALLSVCWSPLQRALGWFLVPLGQASLYVFVLHVPLVLLVANLPGLGPGHVLLDTGVHALLLGVLWLMVRHRVLFAVVPR